MKTFVTDIVILTTISAVVTGVMLLPEKTERRIEKNWGEVYYDPPITRQQANSVLDALVATGTFSGERLLTHKLSKKGDIITWAMMSEPKYRDILGRQLLYNSVRGLHNQIFSNDKYTIEIVEELNDVPDDISRVNEDWGAIVYDDPVTRHDASRMAQSITTSGGYSGTIRVSTIGKLIKYQVEQDPLFAELAHDFVTNAMEKLSMNVFPDDRVEVTLIDKNLQLIEVLISADEIQSIPTRSSTEGTDETSSKP